MPVEDIGRARQALAAMLARVERRLRAASDERAYTVPQVRTVTKGV
ncbi:hypothetical protein [Micromonospora sp. KC723]|nr:hypothetical protein [Micromonospora sp. KC723]